MSSAPNFTDGVPTERDLYKLVATKVGNPNALAAMLEVGAVQVTMIKKRESDSVNINMEILNMWKEKETRKPITWDTLIQALRDMEMNKLARELTEKLEERPRSN